MVARKHLDKNGTTKKDCEPVVMFSNKVCRGGGIIKPLAVKRHNKNLPKHPRITELEDEIGTLRLDTSANSKPIEQNDITNMFESLRLVSTSKPVEVVSSKHYVRHQYEPYYSSIPTPLTITTNLNQETLDLILETGLFNINDLISLPKRLRTILCHIEEANDDSEVSDNIEDDNRSTTFFVDSYWLIKFLDTIITKIAKEYRDIPNPFDGNITFQPGKTDFQKDKKGIIEQTHVLKDQVSLCEWIITSLSGNSNGNNKPPILCVRTLIANIRKVIALLETNNQQWIEFAINRLATN